MLLKRQEQNYQLKQQFFNNIKDKLKLMENK